MLTGQPLLWYRKDHKALGGCQEKLPGAKDPELGKEGTVGTRSRGK